MQSVEKSQYVCAEWDYESIENNELTFKSGDYIKIVSTENDDWWEGILNGFQGFFPANRVRKVTPEETEIVNESINSRRNTLQLTHNLENVTPTTETSYDMNYTDTSEAEKQISPLSPASDTNSTENQISHTQYSIDDQEINMSSIVNNQLPENWVSEYDENTSKYYYRNIQTNETSWEFPL